MFGSVYFRDFTFKMVTHARVFALHFLERELTREQGLFIVSQLFYLKAKFSYSNMASWKKVKDIKISLPINENEQIDFDFMQNFIAELEAYLIAAGLSDYKLTKKEKQALDDFENRGGVAEFKIGDLFKISTGRDIIIGKTQEGDIPLISHQHENNGISKYIKHLENRILFNHKETLSVADRGVFLANTQKENFHIGTRVKALTFKSGQKSEAVRLFFVTAINKLQPLFEEYSQNATDNMPNLKISLPINANGEIDFDFMESFISGVQKTSIKGVIELKDKIIEQTKKAI